VPVHPQVAFGREHRAVRAPCAAQSTARVTASGSGSKTPLPPLPPLPRTRRMRCPFPLRGRRCRGRCSRGSQSESPADAGKSTGWSTPPGAELALGRSASAPAWALRRHRSVAVCSPGGCSRTPSRTPVCESRPTAESCRDTVEGWSRRRYRWWAALSVCVESSVAAWDVRPPAPAREPVMVSARRNEERRASTAA